MGKKAKDDSAQGVESWPMKVGISRKGKGVFAHMVPRTRGDAHTVKMIARETKLTMYSKLILKSDQELALREPIEAVKRESSENIDDVKNLLWGSIIVMGK